MVNKAALQGGARNVISRGFLHIFFFFFFFFQTDMPLPTLLLSQVLDYLCLLCRFADEKLNHTRTNKFVILRCKQKYGEVSVKQNTSLSFQVDFLITKTSLFKYTENFTTKKWKFSDKQSDIFHTSAQKIDCGYSLEPPRRGGSSYNYV